MHMWRKNCWCLVLVLIFVIFLLNIVSGVRINEVMPHTNNSLGNEWIEVYNELNQQINLINWVITDNSTTNRTINLSIGALNYGLIVDNNINFNGSSGCNAIFLFLNDSNFSCFEVTEIGNSLNNDVDSVYLYNETGNLISNISWNSNIQSIGKSWAWNGTDWMTCNVTPGTPNSCEVQQQSPPPNDPPASDIEISLDYDDELTNGEELEVNIDLENLEDLDYDIKIYITPEDENDDRFSETYHEEEDVWKSGRYYVTEIVEGSGDESVTIKVRIDKDNDDFSGDAVITVKVRESDSENIVIEMNDTITILEKEEEDDSSSSSTSSSSTSTSTSSTSNSNTDSNSDNINSNVIKLNSDSSNETKDIKTGVVYKSKIEYFRDYSMYIFALVLLGVIVILIKRY